MSFGLVYPLFAVSIFQQDSIFLPLAPTALRGFWLGVLLAASPLAQFFSSPAVGVFSDRMGRKPILQITFLLILLGYLIAALGVWKIRIFYPPYWMYRHGDGG
jgi:DHA1 family tetracycline resistance protein-like MFS transporter